MKSRIKYGIVYGIYSGGLPKVKRSLTDRAVKSLKPKDKQYKKADGGGLYLLIKPNASKLWRYDFSYLSKRYTLSIGSYPEIDLSTARDIHGQARADLAAGNDPRQRHNESHQLKSFSYYARECVLRQEISESTRQKKWQRIERYLNPVLDRKPVNTITTIDLLNICKPIADEGKRETARYVSTYARQTFNDLVLLQLISINPAAGLSELLPSPRPSENFAFTLEQKTLKALLLGFDAYSGDIAVAKALQFMPLVFLRPKNIRFLKWSHVDFQERLITFQKDDMKMKRPHFLPMSRQVIEILRFMERLTSGQEYVFSTARACGKPMSENTLNQAIKRIRNPKDGLPFGKGVMTSHGWRHVASTYLHELGYESELVEAQLSHADANSVRSVYNKAEYLSKRAGMLQDWANYLDGIKRGAEVVPLFKVK